MDVDDRLAEDAAEFLETPSLGGTFVPVDGRAYLLRHEDAFTDRATMPVRLVTREFFELARSRLAENGGRLYVKLIVPPEPQRLATRVERTSPTRSPC